MGAYSSSLVFLLKARPIINVTTHLQDSELHSIDPGKTLLDSPSIINIFRYLLILNPKDPGMNQIHVTGLLPNPSSFAAPGKAGCSLDPDSPYACFHFSACFRVEEEEGAVDMSIQVTIEAEPKKAVSRVWLRLEEEDGGEGRRSRVEHLLNIQVCQERGPFWA